VAGRRSNSRRWGINRRTPGFRAQLAALPPTIQAVAHRAFAAFLRDPNHPSLCNHELVATKRGRHMEGSRAVSVTQKYRAIYVTQQGINVWYWIGTHNDYESFIGRK